MAPTITSRPAPVAPGGSNALGSWWNNSSPQERTTYISAGANALGGYLDSRQRGKDREQAAQSDAARLEQQRREAQTTALLALLDRERQQQQTALDSSQLTPARQDWRQRQAIMSAILPQLRNAQVTPPGDLVRFMPNMSGGFRLPEGGFDAATLAAFSPQQRLSAEGDLDLSIAQASGGTAPGTDYSSFYGASPQAQSLAGSISDYSAKVRDENAARQQQILAQILGGSGGASAATPFRPSSGATPDSLSFAHGAAGTAVRREQQPAYLLAGGDPSYGASYWEQLTNAPPARDAQYRPIKPAEYDGGKLAPRVNQLDPERQTLIRQYGGVSPKMHEEDGQRLVQLGWTYGQPAPQGYEYDARGLLEKDVSAWKTVGKIAAIGGATALTIATAGATSPAVAAAVGAGSGALIGGVTGGNWRAALTGAVLGGATGGIGAGMAQAGTSLAKQAATQAALGAGGSVVQGGGIKGALMGGAAGAGGVGIGAAGQHMAQAGRPLTQQIAAQAAMHSALGGATGGREGALYGGLSGAVGTAFGGPASTSANRDTQFWAQLAQRSPQLYQALRR